MTTNPTLTGADADELQRAAIEIRSAAERLDAEAATLSASFRSVHWAGGVATSFAGRWCGHHRPQIDATATRLREVAVSLDRQAVEQRRASEVVATGARAGLGVAGGGSGSFVSAGTSSSLTGELEDGLAALGVGRTAISAIAEAIDESGDPAIAQVIELVTHERFVKVLDGVGKALDVGNFVVDVVTDIADHPDLRFDDRLVHALADGAARYAIKEGLERGAEFLAGALTTAMLPGAGAIIAPFVGQAAGAVAQMVLGPAVDQLDEATDFVDWAADRAVDVWRDVTATLGLMVDVVETGLAVVGGAVDLAGDAIEWIGDGLDGAGDWVGDHVDDFVDGAVAGVGDAAVAAADWLGL